MIKPKKEQKETTSDNGYVSQEQLLEVITMLKSTLENQQELSERLDESEKSKNALGEAQLKLVNIAFDTPDNRILELSNIPPNAPRALANEITLENMFHPDVLSGKVPLSAIRRNTWLRANRSKAGTHLMRAIRIAQEQAEAASEQEIEPFNLDAAGS